MTSNNFYQSLSNTSANTLKAASRTGFKFDEVNPELLEVAAKKTDIIWKRETYNDNNFRKDLLRTTARAMFN